MKSTHRTWLAIPSQEKDEALRAHPRLENGQGAIVWDNEHRLWWARPGVELKHFERWLPRPMDFSMASDDPRSEFARVLEAAGLMLDGLPVMNGTLQRVPTRDDKKGARSGAYKGFANGRPAGWYRDYRSDEHNVTKWVFSGGQNEDPLTSLHLRAQSQQNREDSARALATQYSKQADYANQYINSLPQATENEYLARKGVKAAPGVRITTKNELVIPFSNADGQIRSYQRIPVTGGKDARILKGSEKAGNWFTFGQPENGKPVLFAEGYSTAASIHEATGLPVLMTVDANNMIDVAINARNKWPASQFVFCADNDHQLRNKQTGEPQNKGILLAQKAAILSVGEVIAPDFTAAEKADALTDFNDRDIRTGRDVLRHALHVRLVSLGIEMPLASEVKPVHAVSLENLIFNPTQEATMDNSLTNNASAQADPAQEYRANQFVAEETKPGDAVDGLATAPLAPEPPEPVAPVDTPATASTVPEAPQPAAPVDTPATASTVPEVPEPAAPVDTPATASTVPEAPEPAAPGDTPETAPTAPEVPEPAAPGDTPETAPTAAVDNMQAGQADTLPPAPGLTSEDLEIQSQADYWQQYESMSMPSSPAVNAEPAPSMKQDEPEEKVDKTVAPSHNGTPEQSTENPSAEGATAAEARPAPGEKVASEASDTQEAEPVSPRRPAGASPEGTSQSREEAQTASQDVQPDGIIYAPRRPDAPEKIDLDAIIRQLKWDQQPDNTVMYRLNDEPAFRDLGNRLEMANGASTDDKKILAALAVATKFYGGVIELTGSDAFRDKAIALIVENNIDVRMKLPDQRAQLEAMRRERGTGAEAIKTHTPTPDMFTEAPAPADKPAGTHSPQAQTVPSSPADASVQPSSPTMPVVPSSTATPGAATPPPPPSAAPDEGGSPPPKLAPGESVTAVLTRSGEAEYGQNKGQSFFIELSNRDGSQIYWGRELEALVKNVHPGEAVTLTLNDRETFTLPGENRPRYRNHWSLTPVAPGITVSHERPEQGMHIEAYNRAVFNTVMEQVIRAWPEETKGLKVPGRFTGDLLVSEDRHPVSRPDSLTGPVTTTAEAPGQFTPVLGSVNAQTRETELLLVQGAGEHLQGVVRLNGTLYPALATPTADGAQLVINAVTDTGLRFAGYGEALNRHADNPKPAPEHMVFTLKQREEPLIAQVYTPDRQSDELYRRLGFEQTWKQWSSLPKPEDRQEKHHNLALSHSPGR